MGTHALRSPALRWLRGALIVAVLLSLSSLGAWSGPSSSAVASAPSDFSARPAHPGAAAPMPLSPPRPIARPAVPLGSGVDPYAFLSAEPASLGVTDYGLDSSGNGYTYSTPIWWADANISRLLAYSPSDVEGDGYVSFQLNVVLKLTSPGGTPYVYWIQDVVSVDTVGHSIAFLDNVWNLSTGGSMTSGTILGNGSTALFQNNVYFYGDSAACEGSPGGYPGNCVSIAYPYLVTERVTSGEYGGLPHVSFQYDTGSGWVTYDNVSFPFAHGFTDHDFTVDGTQYTPLGLFYDAEWDYTGPGGTMVDRNTSMDLQLERWNGHDLQSVPNAYNFGSNTGEQIQNVISAPEYNSVNGTVGSAIRTGGGSLGPLYFADNVSTLNVTAGDVSTGTITIGGEPHPYVGGEAVFTLAPGSYNVSLYSAGAFVQSADVTLHAGDYDHIGLGYPIPYNVEFIEQGLASGVGWNLNVGGIAYPSPGPSIELELTNGSYNYSVMPVPGYTLAPYANSFTVAGGPDTIYVNFTRMLYPVTVTETGLPAGTSWWVDLGGSRQNVTAASFVFSEPNGTYPYTDGATSAYVATPSASDAVVNGQADLELISFSLNPGFLVGSVSPSDATVLVGGSPTATSDGAFNVTLLPGLYTVEITAPGYNTSWENVTVSPGHASTLAVTLHSTPGPSPPDGGTGSTSGFTTADLELLGAIAAVAVVGILLVSWSARRRRGP